MMPPMLQQTGSFRRHAPLVGIRQLAPEGYLLADFIDKDGGGLIFLLLGGEPLAFIENHTLLGRGRLAFVGPGDGCDKVGNPAVLNDALGGLAVGVQFSVTKRTLVG
jgi:hypothetical protein